MTNQTNTNHCERTILFLVGLVQFINILDFMMLAPLGKQLMQGVGIPESNLSDVIAAYTIAAGISGIAGSFVLDRFDRKKALLVSLAGLILGTALGGAATSFSQLFMIRMLAGAFGGPATSVAIAIVSDVIPVERRGKAMGAVMGAFAAASVLGVPMSLVLAEYGSWRTPFFFVAGLGVVALLAVARWLPAMTGHQAVAQQETGLSQLRTLVANPTVWASYAMTFVINFGAFILIPSISVYLQNNHGLPLSQLKYLYLAGGIVSFFTTRLTGKIVDRVGAVTTGTVGSVAFIVVVLVGFANTSWLPIESHLFPAMVGVFMAFMFSNGVRSVCYNTLCTRVPRPHERARFMSIQSAIQHVAAATGAGLSGRILGVDLQHRLTGFSTVAWISIASAALMPFLMHNVGRRVGSVEAWFRR